ncbi:hypothetical protein CASFOL_030015 [Castilleja foliolosa]|uniref:F-box domain-containing protein n=1 Tax=Castilleja foliolosa TaxID=1961234 RepID=A0ABD3C9K1_9LAMI
MDGLSDSKVNTIPTTKKTEEEGNLEIDVPSKVKYGQSRPYYPRRCKRSDFLIKNINSLPDELVFDIIAQLPAQDIYTAVMNVCLKWYKIIHTHTFVNTHLHRSTCGLLIQISVSNHISETYQLTLMALSRQGRIELTRLNYEPKYGIWCNGCNGLILEWDCKYRSGFFITNPATMQQLYLPQFPRPMCYVYSALAYASVSMEYKVVILFLNLNKEDEGCCAILTVGVDESWRPLRTQHLSLESKKKLLTYNNNKNRLLTTEGFVHWVSRVKFNCILTLNVETEVITEYSVTPISSRDNMRIYYYLSGVKYLSLLIEFRGWSWEVWEMKPETGEWTKLPGIEGNDLTDRKGEIIRWIGEGDRKFKSSGSSNINLQSVGWLKYKEVMLFDVYSPDMRLAHQFCFAWNVRTKEIQFIELDSNMYHFLVHRNSLVWLDGC